MGYFLPIETGKAEKGELIGAAKWNPLQKAVTGMHSVSENLNIGLNAAGEITFEIDLSGEVNKAANTQVKVYATESISLGYCHFVSGAKNANGAYPVANNSSTWLDGTLEKWNCGTSSTIQAGDEFYIFVPNAEEITISSASNYGAYVSKTGVKSAHGNRRILWMDSNTSKSLVVPCVDYYAMTHKTGVDFSYIYRGTSHNPIEINYTFFYKYIIQMNGGHIVYGCYSQSKYFDYAQTEICAYITWSADHTSASVGIGNRDSVPSGAVRQTIGFIDIDADHWNDVHISMIDRPICFSY